MPNKLYYIRRDGLKKTLLDFYNESGMQVSRMSDIERGKAVPTLDEIKVLAKLYEIEGMEVVNHIVDYIGVPCASCGHKYLSDEMYTCQKCTQPICEDCSSGEGEEILCPNCAKTQEPAPMLTIRESFQMLTPEEEAIKPERNY